MENPAGYLAMICVANRHPMLKAARVLRAAREILAKNASVKQADPAAGPSFTDSLGGAPGMGLIGAGIGGLGTYAASRIMGRKGKANTDALIGALLGGSAGVGAGLMGASPPDPNSATEKDWASKQKVHDSREAMLPGPITGAFNAARSVVPGALPGAALGAGYSLRSRNQTINKQRIGDLGKDLTTTLGGQDGQAKVNDVVGAMGQAGGDLDAATLPEMQKGLLRDAATGKMNKADIPYDRPLTENERVLGAAFGPNKALNNAINAQATRRTGQPGESTFLSNRLGLNPHTWPLIRSKINPAAQQDYERLFDAHPEGKAVFESRVRAMGARPSFGIKDVGRLGWHSAIGAGTGALLNALLNNYGAATQLNQGMDGR
jgi:hypothetical protein